NVCRLLANYVREHRIGMAFCDGTGFKLPRLLHTVRGPDAAFLRADRVPPDGIGRGYLEIAPDLVVETLSPSDSGGGMDEQIDAYLTAGGSVVWVVGPRTRRVTIVSATAPIRWVRDGEMLDGGDVVPGFECPVASLFEGLAR